MQPVAQPVRLWLWLWLWPAIGAWGLGRFGLDKQFHGDLAATSAGEMLSAVTGVGAGSPIGRGAREVAGQTTGGGG